MPMAKKKTKKLQTYNAEVNCTCGKPIVFSDKYGMFCVSKCGRKDSIAIGKAMELLFKGNGPFFLDSF